MRASSDGCALRPAMASGGRRIGAYQLGAFRRGWAMAALWGLMLAVAPAAPAARAQAQGSADWRKSTAKRSPQRMSKNRSAPSSRKLEEQIYALKRAEVDALIAQRLLAQEAAKRGITVAALMDAGDHVQGRAGHRSRRSTTTTRPTRRGMRGDEATVRPQIRSLLQQQKLTARQERSLNASVEGEDRRPPRASGGGARRRSDRRSAAAAARRTRR